MEELEKRLVRLEKSAKFWKGITVCLLLLMGALVLMEFWGKEDIVKAQDEVKFDTITANKINIVNYKGKQIANLGGSKDGGWLGINNSEGKLIVGLGINKNSGGLVIKNSEGKPIVLLSASKDGRGLSISNSEGKTIVYNGPGKLDKKNRGFKVITENQNCLERGFINYEKEEKLFT